MPEGYTGAIEVKLENYPELWRSGQTVIDATVTIGQGDRSSSCSVSLADPSGRIAADLIQHSLETGGIQALPGPPGSSPDLGTSGGGASLQGTSGIPQGTSDHEKLIVRECLKQGITDEKQIAYILGTAFHESDRYQTYTEYASGSAYEGRSDLGNNQPGDGVKFKGRGYVQITGRANYQKFSKILGKDFIRNPKGMQDPNVAAFTLVYGMKNGTFTGARVGEFVGGNRANYEGARATVNGSDRASLIAGYARSYEQKIPGLKAAAGGTATPSVKQSTPVEPTTTEGTPESPELFKGNKLTVSFGEYEFEMFHQGTETSDAGVTTLVGQGIRWILNRRKRSKTASGISLKQLADRVVKAHGLTLDWKATFDPTYTHIVQNGITDYQLLLRECNRAGLFLQETGKVLLVQDLKSGLTESTLVLTPGNNLISWRIKDEALDASKEDASSSLEQSEAKTDIDPLTGSVQQTKPDIDPVKDTSVSGKKAPIASGTPAPGQDAMMTQNRARVKRIKGLPSTFVIPLSDDSLDLAPLKVVRTKGLTGTLNRIWVVDSVTHNAAARTTTLNVYSPVEVLDLTPPGSPGVTPGGMGNVKLNPGKFIYPVKGFPVTSPFGPRNTGISGASRMHKGVDVGTPSGTPIVASMDGTVKYAEAQDGYGLVVYITHPDGWETRYAHLSTFKARVGQSVKQGQVIALSGATGVGSGPHLHWEVRDPSGNARPLKDVGLNGTLGVTW